MQEVEYNVDGGMVTDCTNVCFDRIGQAHTFSLNANAVLVQLVLDVDSGGNTFYRRVISLSLIDPEMKDILMEEAHRILAAL